jgi:hypothetical protein
VLVDADVIDDKSIDKKRMNGFRMVVDRDDTCNARRVKTVMVLQ